MWGNLCYLFFHFFSVILDMYRYYSLWYYLFKFCISYYQKLVMPIPLLLNGEVGNIPVLFRIDDARNITE